MFINIVILHSLLNAISTFKTIEQNLFYKIKSYHYLYFNMRARQVHIIVATQFVILNEVKNL